MAITVPVAILGAAAFGLVWGLSCETLATGFRSISSSIS